MPTRVMSVRESSCRGMQSLGHADVPVVRAEESGAPSFAGRTGAPATMSFAAGINEAIFAHVEEEGFAGM